MAKLKIYTYPDDVLAQKAHPVPRVEKEMRRLADDMLETMYDAPGIGLAANQVGILQRILVMDTDYEREDLQTEEGVMPAGKEGTEVGGGEIITNKKPIIIINPRIVHREGEILFEEGCLSVPGFAAEVRRAEKIKVEYEDIDGLTKTLPLEGIQAVCLQHEMDHLDGTLFIEHISNLKREMVQKKLIKERKQKERDFKPR